VDAIDVAVCFQLHAQQARKIDDQESRGGTHRGRHVGGWMRAVLSDILITEGFRVLQAGNGIQALELIKQEEPDVVLMDIRMPQMNGLGDPAAQGRSGLSTSVVIVTGLDDTGPPQALAWGRMTSCEARSWRNFCWVRSLVKSSLSHLLITSGSWSRVVCRAGSADDHVGRLGLLSGRSNALNTILCLSWRVLPGAWEKLGLSMATEIFCAT
jgi:hypothetical protein